jgi:hypothetical protein
MRGGKKVRKKCRWKWERRRKGKKRRKEQRNLYSKDA